MFGFLNVNKPSGITSHQVISKLRKITGIKQIGHAGTLDPLACGVLPVAIGKATKLLDYLPSDKAYIVKMQFGKRSDTYDIEGNVEETNYRKIMLVEIEKGLVFQQGKVKQIPPAFSAVHYNGKRLYELAREGKIPDDIPAREITIYENKILNFDFEKQILELKVVCSKGTYIRTIVNDLGEYTNAGAVMLELTRINSANMNLDDAISLTDETTKADIMSALIEPKQVLDLAIVELNDEHYKKVLNGNKFQLKAKVGDILLSYEEKIVALANSDGEFIQPKKVLL